MNTLLPQTASNGTETLTERVSSSLPPQISSITGNKQAQAGNNLLIGKLNELAKGALPGLTGDLLQQQSAFPYKKYVSFMLKKKDGSLLQPGPNNIDNFKEGYFFRMLVNPSSFVVNEPAKTVVPVRTLGGWRTQFWYPELGSISCEGIIGNMLERNNRDLKDSDAWRGFRKLLTVYRTNGIPFRSGDANRKELQNSFAPIVVCIFDKNQYEGYFESLEYTESEETPHTIKYSFSYKFLNNLPLEDIPGLTREATVSQGLFNQKTIINSAINMSNVGFESFMGR